MTSANVSIYIIEKDGKKVGEYYSHHLCKQRYEELLKFQPLKDHTIYRTWEDEEEEYHENEPINLEDFLIKSGILKNL